MVHANFEQFNKTDNKNMYMVLDTETLGYKKEVAYLNQKVFDLGYKIIDKYNNEYSKGSFIVKEFWEQTVKDYAFYNEKYEYYKEYVNTGYSVALPFKEIIELLNHEIVCFDVGFLVAYNLGFDWNVLHKTYAYFSELQGFEAKADLFGIERFDLYHVASQTVLNTPAYIKWVAKNFDKGHLSIETMNVKTGAESCYSYLMNEPEFIEQHTALSDVEIECVILSECLKTTKDYDYSINTQSWRIPNNRKDKLYLLERQNPFISPLIHDYRVKEKEKKASKKSKTKNKGKA